MRRTALRVSLAAVVLTCAGCAVTYVRTPADPDVLDRIAEQAAEDYSVTRIDENQLQLSRFWPVNSILGLTYTRMRADLRYADDELDGDFYLQSNGLLWLFLPIRIDAADSYFWALQRPILRNEINEVLGYAGTSMSAAETTHGQDRSVALGAPRAGGAAPQPPPHDRPEDRLDPKRRRELDQLTDLRDRGVISEEEFRTERERILQREP